jgi:hypothetical protein
MTLTNLGYHLRQIISHDISSEFNLVPDPFGVTVHSSTSLMGGIWYVMWLSFRSLDWYDYVRPNNLISAVNHVYDSWVEQLEILQTKLDEIQQTLSSKLQLDDIAFRQDADFCYFNQWHFEVLLAIEHSSSQCLTEKIKKINSVFQSAFQEPLEDDESYIIEILTKAEEAFCLFKIKAIIKEKIPFEALKKITSNQKLSFQEEEDFESFALCLMHFINHPRLDKRISFTNLHKGLWAFVNSLALDDEIPRFRKLGRLYYFLDKVFKKEGVNFFTNPDRNYSDQVQKYISESKLLPLSHDSIALGEEILPLQTDDLEKHRVFNTAHHSFEVVVCSLINPLELFLKCEEEYQNDYGLPLAETIEIDSNGILIKEKLSQETMATYLWSFDLDKVRCAERFNSLTLLYQHMVKYSYTPQGFESDVIRFDLSNRVKFTKYLPMGSFDVDELIEVAYECLSDDLELYSHLISECQLDSHEITKAYLKAAFLGLNNQKQQLEALYQQIIGSAWRQKTEIISKAKDINGLLENVSIKVLQRLLRFYKNEKHLDLKCLVRQFLIDRIETLKALPRQLKMNEDEIVDQLVKNHDLKHKNAVI